MAAADVAVIGLGAMGSAALLSLARRGLRVVGVEQFTPGHDRGSSHGETRIIRLGYFEHPSYVPLLRVAYALWRDLERESGEALLETTGIIEIGAPDGTLVSGTLLSSRTHGLAHEVLDAAAVMRRFPPFRVPANMVGVFQPEGGILSVEPAIRVQLALARRAGAAIRTDETVQKIEPSGAGVRVVTSRGTLEAGRVIVAAGPFLKWLLPDFPVPMRVTRQVLAWFEPADAAAFARGRFPIYMIETAGAVFYGFPTGGRPGVKFSKHHHDDEIVDPVARTRPITPADEAQLRAVLAAHLPDANGALLAAETCLYTVTPDQDFIIDRLPDAPNVIIASPCSGHGFKFSPAIGEILADLAAGDETRHDISRFRLARFA